MNNQDMRCKEILETIIPLLEELKDKGYEDSTFWFADDAKQGAERILKEGIDNESF